MPRKSNRRITLSSVDIENFLNEVSADDAIKSSSRRCTISVREDYLCDDVILQSSHAAKIPSDEKSLIGLENINPNALRHQLLSKGEKPPALITDKECGDNKRRMLQHAQEVQPVFTPNPFSEEEKLIRQFCKLRVGKKHYDESVLHLAQEILEKTSYPLVSTRIVYPAKYIYPSTSIEGKRSLLVSLSPMLTASDKQRQEDTLECEMATGCKAIKMKNRHGYEYIDRATGRSVSPEEFERRYRIYLGRENSKEICAQAQHSTQTEVLEADNDEPVAQPALKALPSLPKELIAENMPTNELYQCALTDTSSNNSYGLKRSGNNGRNRNKSRRVTLSPKTAREMILASVQVNDGGFSLPVTASDCKQHPLNPFGTLSLGMVDNTLTTSSVDANTAVPDRPFNTPNKLREKTYSPVTGCSAVGVDERLLAMFSSELEAILANDNATCSNDDVTVWDSASVQSVQKTFPCQPAQPRQKAVNNINCITANTVDSPVQAAIPFLQGSTIANQLNPIEMTIARLKFRRDPHLFVSKHSFDASANDLIESNINDNGINSTLLPLSLTTETSLQTFQPVESNLDNLKPQTQIGSSDHLGVLLDFDGLEPNNTSTVTNTTSGCHSPITSSNTIISAPSSSHGVILIQPQVIDVFDTLTQTRSQPQLFPSLSSIGSDSDAAVFFSSSNPPISNSIQIQHYLCSYQLPLAFPSSAHEPSIDFSDKINIPASLLNQMNDSQKETDDIAYVANIKESPKLDIAAVKDAAGTTKIISDGTVTPVIFPEQSVTVVEQEQLAQQLTRMEVELLATCRLHIRLHIARWKFQWEVVSYVASLAAARRQNGCTVKEAVSQF